MKSFALLYVGFMLSCIDGFTRKIIPSTLTMRKLSNDNISPTSIYMLSTNEKSFKTYFNSILVNVLTMGFFSQPVFAVENSFVAEQLKEVQAKQAQIQKEMIEVQDQNLLSREILYPDGRLVAKGIVNLNADISLTNPYGSMYASDFDPVFENEKSTMFILAVGRDGPPLAAKRYQLNQVKFPFLFEMTSDDLLFPYNEEAWTKSSNSKDSIATTVILTPSQTLATPMDVEYFGFGVSDPLIFAGTQSRTTATLNVKTKIKIDLYTPDEVELLANVDRELDRIELKAKASDTTKKSTDNSKGSTSSIPRSSVGK
eukprot:gene6967-9523_t